ncbi:MAG: alpha/beta hydrolase fold domain-containing protein [Anaerolineae bacterium]
MRFDVPYAHLSPAQKLDIYWPAEGDGPFPIIVSIHGGAFMGGDKRDVQITPVLAGLERGYAVAGVNYRMSAEAKFPALVHDVKAAIRWIRANADAYMFDPAKIAVWGGSAGGYLALMAGVTAGVPELDDLDLGNSDQSSAVQAVVAWFPPTDFLLMDAQLAESGLIPGDKEDHSAADSPESLLLGRKITDVPDLVRAANPETYIRPGAPSMLIQHGLRDDTVPYQQSATFAATARAILGEDRVTLDLFPEARHGDPAFAAPENVAKVLDFLDGVLKS